MTPILPPTRRQSIAWLAGGERTTNGHRIVTAGPIARGHGTVLSVRTETADYSEAPAPREHNMDELEAIIPRSHVDGVAPSIDGATVDQLEAMAHANAFKFYDRQLEFTARLAAVSGANVATECGTGKTLMGIALIHVIRPLRCLVIAPQGVIIGRNGAASQWESEFARFWSDARVQRIRSAASALSSTASIHLSYHQEALMNAGGWLRTVDPGFYDMIIVDESHLLQQRHTIMGRALFRMEPKRRYALTATPVGNKVSDCYRMARWLRPDIPLDIPWTRDRTVERTPHSPLLTYRSLCHVVAPITKLDIRPDMPLVTVHRVMVHPSAKTAEEYKRVAEGFTLPSGGAGQIERVRLTVLRNICADDPNKVRAISSDAAGTGRQRVIVSARIDQTEQLMAASNRSHGLINSTVQPKRNAETAARFKAGQLLDLYLGIKCAFGYSFHDCSEIHVASLEWSWNTFDQAIGRVARINSVRPIHAYVYLLENTIEEYIFDTVCTKQSAAHMALYGRPLGSAS